MAAAAGPVVYNVDTALGSGNDLATQNAVLDQAKASGATWVRLNLSWKEIQDSPDAFDSGPSDTLVRNASRRGLKVMATLGTTPDWASSDGACAAKGCTAASAKFPPKNYGDWKLFTSRLAAHYADLCTTDQVCVDGYEIANEPTLGYFGDKPEEYAHLLSVAYDAIHAADPRALVLNGGLTRNPKGMTPEVWLERVMTNPDYPAATKIDISAIHVRGILAFARETVTFWRTEFDKYGDLASKPMWITEIGYSSLPAEQVDPLFQGTDAASAEAKQAEFYYGTLPNLLVDRLGAVFVVLRDNTNLTTDRFRYEGLVHADAVTRKPSFTAFRALSIGSVASPAAPTGLRVEPTSTSFMLSWTDTSNNEAGFEIERSDSDGPFDLIATVGANVTMYMDAGAPSSGSHSYRARAFNPAGSSSYSNAAGGTRAAGPAWAPADLAVTPGTSSTLALSWAYSGKDEDGFIVERRTWPLGSQAPAGDWLEVARLGANVTTYTDSNLTAATAYTYRVRAYNRQGVSGYSDEAAAGTLMDPAVAPAAAPGLHLNTVTPNSVELAWWDRNSNKTGFVVERRTNTTEYRKLGATLSASVTTFTDTGLAPDTAYTYRVLAVNDAGSRPSSEVTAITATLPLAPANLAVATATSGSVELTWSDRSTNETGFVIERRVMGGAYAQVAATRMPGTTRFTDASVAPNTSYSYRIRAINSAGNSPYSNELTARTQKGAYTRTEDTNVLAVTYRGTWTERGASQASGGTLHTSQDARTPATASFSWHGTAVRVLMARGPQLGRTKITVDGQATTVDLYAPTWSFQQVVYERGGLASKQHTLQVAATGKKNAAAQSTDIALDAVETR